VHPSARAYADALYDAAAIPHDVRWDLPLPTRADTLAYMERVQHRVLDRIHDGIDDTDVYFIKLAVFHEDMHAEAFAITRQTLSYRAPQIASSLAVSRSQDTRAGDAHHPGGTYLLGAKPDEPFVFDNEKWAHPVEVAPFA